MLGPLGQFINGLFTAVQGIVTGIGGILDDIAGFFNFKWTQMDSHEQAIQDLQDQTQTLEGVVGYGQWTRMSKYAYDAVARTIQNDTQVGPVVGCTLVSPGVVQLNSKGLWDITARCYYGLWIGSYTANYVNLMVEVSGDNFATVYSTALSQIIPDHGTLQTNSGTVQIQVRVVVPEAGYRVRWRFQTDPARRIGGGVNFNEIGVLKISDELGPGMRLRTPFTIPGTGWVKVGPMVATGGGTISDDAAVVQPGVTQVRIDAVLTGSGVFDARMIARDTDTVAESLGKSAHTLLSQGAATPGDTFDLWVRDPSGSGTITLNAVNGTWLTIMNTGALGSEAP